MKSFVYVLILFFLIGCGDKEKKQNKSLKPLNYHVIIDVSQRAKTSFSPNQYVIDMKYIDHVFYVFEERVKHLGYLGARDKLSVSLVYLGYEDNRLFDERVAYGINLSQLPLKNRKKVFESKFENLKQNVKDKYQEIASNDHPGSCDLISEFKNHYSASSENDNVVFLITDGLMSFTHSLREGNRSSKILYDELQDKDWEKKFQNRDYGFLKIDKSLPNTKVLVLGFDSDRSIDFYADEKVKLYWQSWFNEMGVDEVFFYQNPSDSTFILEGFHERLNVNSYDR